MNVSRTLAAESRLVQSILFAALALVLYWPLRWLDLVIESRLIGPHTDRFAALFAMFTIDPLLVLTLGFLLQLPARGIRPRAFLAVLAAVVVVLFLQFGKRLL